MASLQTIDMTCLSPKEVTNLASVAQVDSIKNCVEYLNRKLTSLVSDGIKRNYFKFDVPVDSSLKSSDGLKLPAYLPCNFQNSDIVATVVQQFETAGWTVSYVRRRPSWVVRWNGSCDPDYITFVFRDAEYIKRSSIY